MVGTAVATLQFSTTAHTTRTPDAAAAKPAAVTASESVDRTEQRADRSEQRITAAPDTTPSTAPTSAAPPPSAKPSKAPPPKPPTGGGAVVSSGTCQASFYTDEGNRTANGETFHVADFTAASKTLPFNTKVRVTNTKNGKSVVVRINDRGPFVAGRCLDLTPAAFNTISSQGAGVATVKFEVLQG